MGLRVSTASGNATNNRCSGSPTHLLYIRFIAELFRDHGFIEPYPQTWTLPEGHFELEVEDNGVKQVFSIPKPDVTFQLSQVEETFKITWLEKPDFDNFPKAKSQLAGWLREKLRALQRLKALGEYEDVPLHEQKTIWDFHHAFITALQYAIQDMEQKINSTEIDPKWGLDHHYEDFRFEEDWISYNEQRCNSSEFTDFRHYDTYAIEQSNYQTMKWQLREADDDMCLHLDGMLQICSSYRPHYHEFFVHFTARYISQIKRVIFLGSGDAMLLHEILKYPQLEKVVGLELDQQVTRKSFQFFKTQPHYDDERVEWWYGDATKTLPLLPRDYWGTFDLVLVDLSETVVSMSVTGKHDIFEVISMLLKPEGILLENELYKEKMSKNFDHTIQIFYGSPKVCTQVLTMSSNQVDFLHYPIHNHGVDAFLLDPEQDSKEPFKYFHDYIKSNAQEQGKCQDDPENGGSNAATIEHGRTAGVLQIVEAENAGFGLKDHQEIQEAIYAAVTKEGLTPISSPSNDNGVVVVAMKEGYVVARMWPEHKYCAFDINLWGGFQKAFKLRSSLVEAVKSSSVSTYRIVVGGMNGASTWEEDQEVIGVEISQKRSCQMEALSDKAVLNQEILNVAMAETVALLDSTSADIVVAVACGIQGEDKCPMTDALAQHPRVKRVVTLWTCARLAKNIDAMWDLSKVHDCEKSLIGQLEEVFDSQGLKLDMLFIDNSAPYSMIQILNSIWRSLSHRNNWLKKDRYVFVTPFHKEERYHQGFLERYRREQHSSTLSTAELVFKGSEGTEMGLAVLVSGDDAPTRFYDVESKIRERLPNVAMEITSIIGGEFHPEKDLKYEGDEFTPDRYDFRPSQEQFLQQQPLGRQTIFQLDSNVEDALIFGDLSTSLEQTLKKMNYGPSRFDKFLDVGDGGLIVSIFPQGSVILVWDGRKHVDINLFSFDQNREKADTFVDTFTTLSGKTLQVSLRDDQPRGFGRVVSFTSEIESPNYITYGATES